MGHTRGSRPHPPCPTVHYLLEEVVDTSPEDVDISSGPALLYLSGDEGEAVLMPIESEQAGHAGGGQREGRMH